MLTRAERDAMLEAQAPKASGDVLLSEDPSQIVVTGHDGKLIDWESRKGFGQQTQALYYPERAGFHRHWFNDTPGRVDLAHNAGYTNVLDADGRPVARVVDKHLGTLAYLMELPEAWYKADIALAQKRADEVEISLRKGIAPGPNGEAGAAGENYYGAVKIGRKAGG